MKKSTKTIIGIFLGLLVLGIIFGVIDLTGTGTSSVGGGGTVQNLSISPETPISNDPNLQNTNFLIQFTVNGGGEKVIGGTIPKTAFQAQGLSQPYDIQLNVTALNQTFFYEALNANPIRKIYKYDLVTRGLFDSCPTEYSAYIMSGLSGKICVQKKFTGTAQIFSHPTNAVKATFVIDYGNKHSNPITIDTLGQSSVEQSLFDSTDGSYIGTIKWAGNLVNGQAPPNFDLLYIPVKKESDQKYIVAGDGWAQYSGSPGTVDSQLLNYQNNFLSLSCFTFQECVNTVQQTYTSSNNMANGLMTNNSSVLQVQNSSTGEYFLVEPRSFTQNPVFTLRLKASWMGTQLLTSKPQLQNCPYDLTFNAGSTQKTVGVSIKNIGNSEASFGVRLNNCQNFKQIATNPASLNLLQNASGTIGVTYDAGTSNSKIDETCQIQAYALNDTTGTNVSNCSIGLHLQPSCNCTANKKFAQGENIYLCEANCTSSHIVEHCDSGVLYNSSGEPYCIVPAKCGNGKIDQGEDCDGALLNNKNCSSVDPAYNGGTLACSSACTFDVSGCQGVACLKDSDCTAPLICTNGKCGGNGGICTEAQLASGYTIQQKDTPEKWWIFDNPFGGKITTTTCVPPSPFSNPIVIIVIILVIGGIAYAFISSGKKKRGK
jgi:hypothetical protein